MRHTLNTVQSEVMHDFISISSTLQLEMARFLIHQEGGESFPSEKSVLERQLLTLKENFAYCELEEISGSLGHFIDIFSQIRTGNFSATPNVTEALQQAFDCLIHHGHDLLSDIRQESKSIFLDIPLRSLVIACNQNQAEEAADAIFMNVVREHQFHESYSAFDNDFEGGIIDFSTKISSKDFAVIEMLIFAQETRNNSWIGRINFQIDLALKLNEFFKFPCDERQLIFAVCYHDIGMIYLPDSILLKHGSFDVLEREKLKKHVDFSCALLDMIPDLSEAKRMIYQHHEEFNGKGYPDAIPGTQICIGAQILTMCDVYYSLTHSRSDRPFRKSILRALLQIKRYTSLKFSNEMVVAISSCVRNEFKSSSLKSI